MGTGPKGPVPTGPVPKKGGRMKYSWMVLGLVLLMSTQPCFAIEADKEQIDDVEMQRVPISLETPEVPEVPDEDILLTPKKNIVEDGSKDKRSKLMSTIPISGDKFHTSTEKIEVNQANGSASLSIPIAVPSGRAGIQPNVSLNYNSNGSNGPLGMGWMMGLGSIQRSLKKGIPQYNNNDAFVMLQSGSPMELSYDSDQGFYRHKIEGAFMKITFKDNVWIAQDKRGTKYYFGQSNDSRKNSSSRIFAWYLDRVEDLNGNFMTISYQKEQGEVYPKHIDYTGHRPNNEPPFARVTFSYQNRDDQTVSYRTGFKVATTLRLTSIESSVQGNLMAKYGFVYQESPETHRSLLSRVTQYGDDGSTALPSTTFAYSNNQTTFSSAKTISAHPNVQLGLSRLNNIMDMDANGLPDMVRTYPGNGNNYQIYKNTSQGSKISFKGAVNASSPPVRGTDNENVKFADFNADGMLDVIYGGEYSSGCNYRIWINKGQGNGYESPVGAGSCPAYPITANNFVQFVDMNSDGRTDILETYSGVNKNYKIYFMKKDSVGFESPITAANSPTRGTDNPNIRFADFNGDSLLDVIYGEGGTYQIWINNGKNGFNSARNISQHPEGSIVDGNLVQLLDMNGDGLTDMVKSHSGNDQPYYIYFNNGSGDFNAPITASNFPFKGTDNTNIKFADMNGDGLVDVFFGMPTEGWRVWLNNGKDGFFPPRNISQVGRSETLDHWNFMVTDLNGDGLPELMMGNRDENYWAWVNSADSRSSKPNVLVEVNNGVGAKTQIKYNPAYIKGLLGARYKLAFGSTMFHTVESVTASTEFGHSYTTRYEFKDGFWKHDERDFYGFGHAKVIDPDGNYSETTFLQTNEYLKQRVKEQSTFDAQGNLYSKTVNTWETETLPNTTPQSKHVRLRRKDQFIYDGNSSGKRTAQEMYYEESPQLGNVTKTVSLGEVDLNTGADVGEDSKSVKVEYHNNTQSGQRLIGFPKYSVSKDHRRRAVSKKWIYYDGSTDNNSLPAKGQVTKKQDWLRGSEDFDTNYDKDEQENLLEVVESRHEYDGYGNVINTYDAKGNKNVMFYDTTYHIFPLKNENALGHVSQSEYYGVNGVALSGGGYHGLFGQVKSVTDANSQTSMKVYDIFGRPTKAIGPLDTLAYPSSEMIYDYQNTYLSVYSKQRIDHGKAPTVDKITFYDGLGRLIQTKERSESQGQYVVSGQTEYNTRGLPVKKYVSFFSQEPFGAIVAVDTSRAHTLTVYDVVGRAVKTIFPDGTYASVSYDDWETMSINPNGHMQKSIVNSSGQLIRKEEYQGADGRDNEHYPQEAYQLYSTTRYEYDAKENLRYVYDNANNKTTIVYDNLGRKTAMRDPDMGTWRYGYDLNSNLVYQRDANGNVIHFEYDALNRLMRKYDNEEMDVRYFYDDFEKENAIGRLSKVVYGEQSEGQQTEFFYDVLGREVKSIKTIDGNPYVVEKEFNALDQVTRIVYPDKEDVNYAYNAAGQVEIVSQGEISGWQNTWDHVVPPKDEDKPFAHYTFNEIDGNVIKDYGIGKNDGIASDDLSRMSSEGRIGQALSFNGIDQYAELNSFAESVKSDSVGTISFWVYKENGSERQQYSWWGRYDTLFKYVNYDDAVLSKMQMIVRVSDDSFDGGFHLEFGDYGKTKFLSAYPRSELSRNKWELLTFVQNGNDLKIYVNGRQNLLAYPQGVLGQEELRSSWFNVLSHEGKQKVFLGSGSLESNCGFGCFFKGGIDDFRYYKRALTSEEIIAIYNNGQGTEESVPIFEEEPDVSVDQRDVQDLFIVDVDYNEHGQTTKIEYGNGNMTTYLYEAPMMRLRRIKTVDKDGEQIQNLNYSYDASGNIMRIHDAVENSASANYSYDHLSRLARAQGSYGQKFYEYDALGNIFEKDKLNYVYGENGAGPHAVTSLSDGSTFDYDRNGNMVEMVKSGVANAYDYDQENRLTQVTKDGQVASEYAYDGDGGRTKKIVHEIGAASMEETCFLPGTPILMADGTSKPIEQIKEGDKVVSFNEKTGEKGIGSVTQKFEHENTDRYLIVNNTLRVTSNHLFYNEGKWKKIYDLSVGDALLGKGLNTRRIFNIKKIKARKSQRLYNIEVSKHHNYFAGGYLVHNKMSFGSLLFDSKAVDSGSALVASESTTKTTHYVGSLVERSGVVVTKFIYLGGTRIASITTNPIAQSTLNYYHADHLGGTNLVTSSEGELKELIEYEPFGEMSRHEKYGDNAETAWFYFTGQRRDDETGLYYYGARYYNPWLGRFLTPDVFVFSPNDSQNFDRYGYARNNPILITDPTGNYWWVGSIVGGVLGGVSAAINGQSIWKGIVAGAVAGTFTSGFSNLWGFWGAVSGGALGGAAQSGITGGNVGAGAAGGAIGGGIGYGFGQYFGSDNFAGGMTAAVGFGALSGGITSEIFGGDFGGGALMGAAYGGAGYMGAYTFYSGLSSRDQQRAEDYQILKNGDSLNVNRGKVESAASIESDDLAVVELYRRGITVNSKGDQAGPEIHPYMKMDGNIYELNAPRGNTFTGRRIEILIGTSNTGTLNYMASNPQSIRSALVYRSKFLKAMRAAQASKNDKTYIIGTYLRDCESLPEYVIRNSRVK